MNCERCQELIGDLLDGTLSGADESTLKTHLHECLDCDSVRQDLSTIVSYCRAHRGEYDAPPNVNALWVRIRNSIEIGNSTGTAGAHAVPARKPLLGGLLGRSWELSLPQLAAFAGGIVLCVAVITAVGVRRWQSAPNTGERTGFASAVTVNDRIWQRQQVINYWNQRVELNKARWSAQMRETFDRNMSVIDQAVTQSLDDLNRNPHDEVSEQMLNEALNDKLALLKEFSDL